MVLGLGHHWHPELTRLAHCPQSPWAAQPTWEMGDAVTPFAVEDTGGQRGKELAQGQGLAEAGSNPSLAPTSPLHCPRAEASSPYRAARQAGDRRLQLCSLG